MKIALQTLKDHPWLLIGFVSFGVLAYAMNLALAMLEKVQG